jgi:hypothetical protein
MDATTQTPEAEAPVVATEAPAPVKAVRKAAPKAKPAVKATAKAKPAPAKKVRTPIPEGMTRSRGSLIPKASGKCAFTGAKGQCANPGRWTVKPENVLSCTTHKQSAKRTVFAPQPKARARKPKVAVATA